MKSVCNIASKCLIVFFVYFFVLWITISTTILAGYIIISFKWYPFTTICCLLLRCRVREEVDSFKGREEEEICILYTTRWSNAHHGYSMAAWSWYPQWRRPRFIASNLVCKAGAIASQRNSLICNTESFRPLHVFLNSSSSHLFFIAPRPLHKHKKGQDPLYWPHVYVSSEVWLVWLHSKSSLSTGSQSCQ